MNLCDETTINTSFVLHVIVLKINELKEKKPEKLKQCLLTNFGSIKSVNLTKRNLLNVKNFTILNFIDWISISEGVVNGYWSMMYLTCFMLTYPPTWSATKIILVVTFACWRSSIYFWLCTLVVKDNNINTHKVHGCLIFLGMRM